MTGDNLYSGSADHTIINWNLRTLTKTLKFRNRDTHCADVLCLESIFVPGNPGLIASGGADCEFKFWNLDGSINFSQSEMAAVTAIKFFDDYILLGLANGAIVMRGIENGLPTIFQLDNKSACHGGAVVGFERVGSNSFLSAGRDGYIMLWGGN